MLNELLWAGSHEAAGVFKDMITDKRITINEKHQVQRPETYHLHAGTVGRASEL